MQGWGSWHGNVSVGIEALDTGRVGETARSASAAETTHVNVGRGWAGFLALRLSATRAHGRDCFAGAPRRRKVCHGETSEANGPGRARAGFRESQPRSCMRWGRPTTWIHVGTERAISVHFGCSRRQQLPLARAQHRAGRGYRRVRTVRCTIVVGGPSLNVAHRAATSL